MLPCGISRGWAGIQRLMGSNEHQRRLDERFAVESALVEAVMTCRSVVKVLGARTDELSERVTGLEKVVRRRVS